ncbi:MAG: PAS domain-containing protein, partial [Actinomycetota bacterium]|nr:PAS domain-containing protein [Actinomycetota bacterium]
MQTQQSRKEQAVTRDPDHPSADPVQRLFELAIDMLGTASTDGYFTELNPAWERTLDWTPEELMAEPYISFVHPDDVDTTIEQAARLAKPGNPSLVAFENRYRTRDGDYRSLLWTAVGQEGVVYF